MYESTNRLHPSPNARQTLPTRAKPCQTPPSRPTPNSTKHIPHPARQTLPKRPNPCQTQPSPISIKRTHAATLPHCHSIAGASQPTPFALPLIFYKTKPPKTNNYLNSIVHNNLHFKQPVATPPFQTIYPPSAWQTHGIRGVQLRHLLPQTPSPM